MPKPRTSKFKISGAQIDKIVSDRSPFLLLPSELIGLVFSQLRAADVGRGASSCKHLLHAASTESNAWDLAIVEFDPFCALGKGDEIGSGFWKVWECAGKSWTRVMSALAGKPQSCSRCPGTTSTVLCQCPVRITRSSSASSLSSSQGGFIKKCGEHYTCPGLESGSCLKFDAPIFNMFVFPREPFRTVVADKKKPVASGIALQEAIDDAPAFSTIHIKGKFCFEDECLFLDSGPLRIVGKGQGAKIISLERPVIVSSLFAAVENVSVNMKTLYERGEICNGCGCYHGEEAIRCPGLQVNEDCSFIGEDCKINCEMGTAFLMAEMSAKSCNALLMNCSLSSDGHEENCGGALCIKERAIFSAYGCKIEGSLDGADVSFGSDQDRSKTSSLLENNTFNNPYNDHADMAMDSEYDPQTIQPWVNCGWQTHRPQAR